MIELTEFLLARTAEAEARIRHGRKTTPCIVGNTAKGRPPVWRWPYSDTELAACEATRRIVAQTVVAWERNVFDNPMPEGSEWLLGRRQGLLEACHELALPYADHPDYRQEWRPSAPHPSEAS